MGDAQSAQRDAKKDAEQSGAGEDVQSEQSPEDEPLETKEPISELNGKADGSLAGFIGHSEDAAEGIPSPDKDVSDVEINAKTPPEEEEVPVKTIEMEAKQNEINESFRRFFSNIGFKLTVKKSSAEKGEIQVPEEEPNKEDVKDTAKENENAEQNKDLVVAQDANDNDSTTGPTMTDGTSEDFLETETKKEAEHNKADEATTSHGSECGHLEAAPEEVVASPFKRFFKTGIFSGLRKRRRESVEKELMDMGKKEAMETTEETVQDQQQDKAEAEDATVWRELQEITPKDQTTSAASAQTTDEAKSPSTDPSAIIVTESEILSSQEKVQASPMKRLLSGSSLKKLSKKQRGRKLSDGRLSDSGEHSSDHLMSSTESADNPREDSSPQSSAEATGEDEGPWASFKKLLTPKKRIKGSSGQEEAQVPAPADDAKPSEGEKISDHSSEEGRKRKDSSVSWEAVLCGSGRRRSRKTSDSEDESPQNDNADNKHDSGAKQGTETQPESSNEVHEILASSPRQAGSPPGSDGGSTWKSFKKLVTPKRKAKDEDESKDYVHSDSEITQDDSSFSIKKLLPGRKKRKSGERQDQVSSDEAEKEAASGEEDSETPAVVPLSEFDETETGVQIQTQADVESYEPKELEDKLEQDDKAEPVVPHDNQQIEAEKVQNKEEAIKNEASAAPVTKEEEDEELISKHQQLSDITEEGAITDTMATPASTNEEAARDDTIAEDLIEITSEAITAPEPVDVTLADETEMISAVSQLSESSKTSGNTTPVPAELDDKDTGLLLQNVAQNIQMSQEAVPKERPSLDVEATKSHELEATAQSEGVSDTNEAMSTDLVSDVPTEEFDTAEITADDAYKEDVSQLQDTVSELEVTDDSQHPVECVSEVNEAVSVETLPEGEEVVTDSAVEADEVEISKMDSQEAEPAAAVAGGTEDRAVEQEIQILAEKKDQVIQNVLVQVPVEDQPPVVADKQEVLATVETDELASERGHVKSLEKDVPLSENISPAEKVTDEPKHLTGVTVEPEDKKPQTDAPKTDHHEVSEAVQEAMVDSEEGRLQLLEKEVTSEEVPPEQTVPFPEVGVMLIDASKSKHIQEQEVLQAATLDSEGSSPESLAKEVISEDVPQEETVRDEPKEEPGPLVEGTVEPVDASKVEHIQEPETLQAVIFDSESSSPELPQKDVISEAVPSEETVRDEPTEEPVPLAEVNVEPVDAPKAEHVLEPETLRAAKLDTEAGSPESIKKDETSEDVPSEETVGDEPKQEPMPLAKVDVEPVDAPKTKHIQEPEVLQAGDASKEPDVLQVVQAATLDSKAGSPQLPEKEVKSEDVPPQETVGEEPKTESVPLAEVNVEPVDAPQTEHIQEPETLQAATINSEAGSPESLEKEETPEDAPSEETVRNEPKQETVTLAEVIVEPVDAPITEYIQEPEVLQAGNASKEPDVLEVVQAATLDSEAGNQQLFEKEVKSEDVPPEETVGEESKKEPVLIAEVNVEPVDAPKTEHIQETETLHAAMLDPEAGSPVPSQETVRDEPKEEPAPLAEDNVEPVDAPKTEHIQEPETFQAAMLGSEAGSPEMPQKEVTSEDVPQEETARDEPKQEPVPLAEVNAEDPKTKHIQEPEAIQAGDASKEPDVLQAAILDSEPGSPQLLEKEVKSEDVPPEETVEEEPKTEPVPLAEVNVEPVDAPKTKHIQEPETLQAVTLNSEAGSPELSQAKVISQDAPSQETVKEKPKEEPVPLADANVEPVDAPKTEHIQVPETIQAAMLDSEAGSPELPQKEVTSEDVPSEETVGDELKQEPVPLAEGHVDSVDASKTEHMQEPETLQAATLHSEASSFESHENNVTSEDVPPEETVKDEPKEETVPLVEVNVEPVDSSREPEALQASQGTTSDSVTDEPKQTSEVRVEQEETPVKPKVLAPDVKEAITETETGAATLSLEKNRAQETQIVFDDTPKPTAEDVIASVPEETENKVVDQTLETNNDQKTKSLPQGVEVELEESTTEAVGELPTSPAVSVPSVMEEASCVQIIEETVLSKETPEPCADSAEASDEPTHEVQVNGVGDEIDELGHAEMKTAEIQHVVVMQVTTCNVKDELPSVLVEKTSETYEPLIEKMAGERELQEAVERATPLVEDSVEVEDSHRIQVQVVDVDIKSLMEVVVTEDKEVTVVCPETIDRVEVLSATSGIEDEVFNKEAKAAAQEVQNVEAPGRIPESLVISLEREIMKEALTEVVENASSQAQKLHVSEDNLQRSEIPEDLDVSVSDHKEDLKETKVEDETCLSEELAVMKVDENTIETQQTSQIVTTSNTGQQAPQNTGIISSEGNVESPSSFSLEVQTKVQESPSPPTDTLKPLKQTDVSEVGVQVVEAVESINLAKKAESEKQITEPAVNLDSTQQTKTTSQAAQLDVGIQAMETAEPVEEITSTETVTPNVQAAETIQPETQTETREVFLSQPALYKAKAEEPRVRQTQEENDEDVWLDAEEEIYAQAETEKVEEPQKEDEKEEHLQETQKETHETEGTPESEIEHFAPALEHPEIVTASDTTTDLN